MSAVGISAGSWMPTMSLGGAGVTGAYGAARQFRDGIFIRSQLLMELAFKQRMNEMVFAKIADKVPQVASRKGQRFTFPTVSIPAVGDVVSSITTSGYSYPDYAATDSFSTIGDKFGPSITGSNTTVLGIPVPLQRLNEGEVELLINQYRGLAMMFTKDYLEVSLLENPSKYYGEMIRYALNNDMERYMWLTCLYLGPITETADDYGTLFNDAIGITNKANYTLTRTLTSVGTGSNLITAQTNATAPSMSNSSNSRFGTSPNNVPWLFGSTASDISFSTVNRLREKFDSWNVPLDGRHIISEAKGYGDFVLMPQFINNQTYPGGGDQNKTGRLPGSIQSFQVHMTNVIQPTGASSNVLYEVAIAKDALKYGVQREPSVIIDNMLDKKEQALVLLATERYGATGQRPDHIAIIQTRTRV